MTASVQMQRPPSAFKVEWNRFRTLSRRYLEQWLNEFFDLSLAGPLRRTQWITIIFVLFVLINIVVNAPSIPRHLGAWLSASQGFDLWNELLFVLSLAGYIVIPFFVASYFALEMAARYLADIFELNHIETARTFLRQLSLTGGGHAIRVRGGKVVEEDLESPIIKIGGPGIVVVEFDSAALFEKPDGTPHIIGPANLFGGSENKKANIILDGFERFRAAIDLRDHYIGDPSGEPLTVKSLSLEGLPISATDVRAVYSVRRAEDRRKPAPTKELPYPYTKKSIGDLIYQMSVSVLTDDQYPSDLPRSWTGAAHSLIRGAISEFMNENNLSEYLASFGAPEVEQAESQERTIQFQRFEITSDRAATTDPPDIPQPKFHPRTELSGIFDQLSNRFTKRAHDRGIDVHWIGVGTWKIPDKIASDIINGQHLLAWQINRENIARGSEEAFEHVFNEAYVAQKTKLIRNVPLSISRESETKGKGGSKAIMNAYWELLGEAAQVYYTAGDPLPRELEQAIRRIEFFLFSGQHYVGGHAPTKLRAPISSAEEKTPPAPETPREGRLYPQLLRLLDGDYKKAEWLIEYESKKLPEYRREQIVQYLIDHPELCNI